VQGPKHVVLVISTRSRWMIWAICILHCIVSSETQFETWWWPSARAETCCLSNKYSATLLVVFWLYYPHHLIVSNTRGMSQLKIHNAVTKGASVRRRTICSHHSAWSLLVFWFIKKSFFGVIWCHPRARVCVDNTSTLLNTCREPGVQTRGVPPGFMCLHAFCNTKCRFQYGSQHRNS